MQLGVGEYQHTIIYIFYHQMSYKLQHGMLQQLICSPEESRAV